ncbi:hypothetical protein POM88_045487 [Heracleum sosnowskyi]|uniref:ABC transmembrane type-1 domain-containing protein n=1 Tax=Heracleum sosnowskyi TaxID=360622 RepID=A0AAD8H6K1_9APIA|nr:hypothetical protein POM88_045487 [Heracleum sosnowskyi]
MHKNFPEHKINSKIISTNKTRTVLSTDAATVRSLVGDALALVVQNMATVVAGVVIEFTANWILALVMYEQASQVANDAVGSIRTVASFCVEEKVMDMYQKKCDGPMKSGIRLEIVSSASLGVGSSVLFLVNSFIFYIGSVLEKHGKATFAEIFRVFFALTMTAIGVSMTISMAPDIDKVKNSAASIFQILDSKPKIDPAMKKAQL